MKEIHFKHNLRYFLFVLRINFELLNSQKSLWISLFLFSLVLLIIFPFALGTETLKLFEVQIGSFWIIQEFMVSLLILNMFKFEEYSNIMDIYFSNRASRLSFFFGKIIFSWIQLISLQFPLIIFWIIIFNPDTSILYKVFPTLFLASILFSFSSSLLGGFLYNITRNSKIKEIIQPLLFFPLQSALLLAGVGSCLAVKFSDSMFVWSGWWNIFLTYPTLLLGLTLLLGEILLEE